MQACCLQQHAATTVHKVATKSFLLPDLPISQCLPYSLKDQQLLNGNVPQPLDWLRAWRACKATASFEGAVSFYQTDECPWLQEKNIVPELEMHDYSHALGSQEAAEGEADGCNQHQCFSR